MVQQVDVAGDQVILGRSGTALSRDHALAGAAMGLAFLIILVGTAFRVREFLDHSLWLDEAWAALGVRTNTLPDFLLSLSATPVLFALTSRLSYAIFQHPELGVRFLPVAFSLVTLALAFRLGRELQGRVGGLLALVLVGVQPEFIHYAKMFKQYSADTAFALAIVWLGVRFAQNPSKSRAIALVVVACIAPGFSYPALFANAGLLVLLLLRAFDRKLGRSRRQVVAMVAPIVVASSCFFFFGQRYANPSLVEYWRAAYLPADPIEALRLVYSREIRLLSPDPLLGPVLLGAAMVAVACLVVRRRLPVVVMFAVIAVGSIAAAVLGRYPFGDPRTGSYATALVLVFVGVGFGFAATIGPIWTRLIGVMVLVAVMAWGGPQVQWMSLGQFTPVEELGPMVRYLDANRKADDVIVVYYASVFGYAYYGSDPYFLRPTHTHSLTSSGLTDFAAGRPQHGCRGCVSFTVQFTDPRTVVLNEHRDDPAAYDVDVRKIVARSDQRRIWLVMSHKWGDEFKYIPKQFSKFRPVELKASYPDGRLFLVNPN